jgi:hypothetical protein
MDEMRDYRTLKIGHSSKKEARRKEKSKSGLLNNICGIS